MSWTLRKAEKKDSDRINELFIEMLQTIYNTDRVNGYSEGDLDRLYERLGYGIYEDQGSRYLMIKNI